MKKSIRSKQSRDKRIKEILVGYSFILPVIIGILGFTFLPMIQSLYYSFFKTYDVISAPEGFGLYNYIKIFTRDDTFYMSILRTVLYSLFTVPFFMVLGFMLALLINNKLKGIKIYRVLMYLPVIIPGIVFANFWQDVFRPTYGLANALLSALGLRQSLFLRGEWTVAMPTLIFTGLWGVGGGMILWLASLRNVPEALYESARIDGAGAFTRLFRITIPLCTPIIFYNLIMGIIGSLQTFGNVFLLTNGYTGKDNALLFYVMKVYYAAFGSAGSNMAYAAALSWILFILIAALAAVIFRTSKWVFYGEDS